MIAQISLSPTPFTIVLLLLLSSFLLSLGLSIYALRIQQSKAASSFGILMLILALWVLLKIISIFVFAVDLRELLHKFNLLLTSLVAPYLLLVAVYHTNSPSWFTKKHARLLFVFPAIVYLLLFISPFYNVLFKNFQIIVNYGIPIHIFDKTIVYILVDIYNYILIISTFILLAWSLPSKTGYFRQQMILFIVGLSIPVIYDASYILGFSIIKGYNLSPVFLSIGNCFLAWSMFGYRFFKILPVARNLIIDNMPDIMIIVSNDNSVIDINKSGEEIFNCKKEQVIGLSFEHVFKQYPKLIEAYNSKGLHKELPISKNNISYYYSVSLSPLIVDKQTLANILLLHEITERIEAEKQIRKLSVAIEQSPITIVITDTKGDIEYVNPAFCRITGYTAEEAIGNNPRVLKGLTPDETFTELWKTVTSGQVWNGEFINRKKLGEYYYEEAIIAPVKNDKDEITNFIAIKNDISHRKQIENKIQQQNEELKALNATKDKFFSIIAHDLRSPFGTILGFSDYMVNNFDSLEKEDVKTYIGSLHSTASQTYKLLENLLEWSKMNQGLAKPDLQNHLLKPITIEMESINAERIKSKSITFHNNIGDDFSVNCDIDMTKTILRNLISNALKFTGNEGLVSISASRTNDFVEIQIKDSGVGIPESRIQNLFSIENNMTTLGTAKEKGTGLGLLLCKELVEIQGGKIWVESIDGKGSIFFFTLPISK